MSKTGECCLSDCFCHDVQQSERDKYRSNHEAHLARGIPAVLCHSKRYTYCVTQCIHQHGGNYCGYQWLTKDNDFDREWTTGPQSMKRTTEYESAAYWFERGGQCKYERLLHVLNNDLRELRRLVKERL